MSARDELLREMTHNHLYMDDERANELVDAAIHEAIDRARRGVTVLEEHVGGFQYSRDVREILDIVDPTTPDPDGWKF